MMMTIHEASYMTTKMTATVLVTKSPWAQTWAMPNCESITDPITVLYANGE